MAQLDRLLSVMVSQRATALRLDESELAELEIAGAPRPVTKTAAHRAAGRSRCCARSRRPTPRAALDAGHAASLRLRLRGRRLRRATRRATAMRWRARVTLDERRERAARQRPSAPSTVPTHERAACPRRRAAAAAAAPPPPAAAAHRGARGAMPAVGDAATPSASSTGSERARATLDVLLRTMVEQRRLRPAPPLRRAADHPPARRDDAPGAAARSSRTSSRRCSARSCRSATGRSTRETNDTDYAYEIAGRRALPRQRARRTATAPPRCSARFPATVVTVEQMGITPEVQKLCQLNKGLVLVTGPTGLGQVHDAVLADRPREPLAHRSRHHDRGPDRVRAPEQEVHHHAAAGGRAHRLVQERAARRAARGSGHHPRRRAARPRDGRRSRSRRRRRATSCSARCTRRRRPARSTASSTSSPPTGRRRSA